MTKAQRPTAAAITGGTKGIGLSIAKKLAQSGAFLFLIYGHDEAAAQNAKAEVEALGSDVELIRADLAVETAAQQVMARITSRVSHLDALIHSAALPNPGSLIQQDMSEIRAAIEVGGMALLYLVRAGIHLLSGGGNVLFLSGASTNLVLPNHGALASAKALGDCMVKYLAVECAPLDVNFNILGAGPIDTELSRAIRGGGGSVPKTPIGRELEGSDLAEVAAFLVSDGAKMIRGQSILVDGGLGLTPRKG